MLRGLRHRASGHRHLLTGSAAVVANMDVHAVTGSVYWLLAARLDSQHDVGHATALYTSVLFVAFLAGLGLPVAIARYGTGTDREDHVLYTWAVVATTLASTLGAAIYLVSIRSAAVDELLDWNAVLGPVLFATLTIGGALSLLVDVRLMTQRRWGLVLARAVVVGVIRFPLLLISFDTHRPIWLLTASALPTALTGIGGVLAMRVVTGDGLHLGPTPAEARPMVRFSLVNWVSTISYQLPTFAMPVIVLVSVSARANASFYVAWGVVGVACYVPTAIGQALLTEGGRDGAHLRSQVRLALGAALGLMVVTALAASLLRGLLPVLYGHEYQQAADVLPTLMAATIPWAITSIYLTEARVQHRTADTVTITIVLSLGTLLPALLVVPDHGLAGAATSFLVGNLLAAVAAIVAHRRSVATTPVDPLLPAAHEDLEPDDVVALAPLT
jgi:O-antigen/teichoic acid export membrane protein